MRGFALSPRFRLSRLTTTTLMMSSFMQFLSIQLQMTLGINFLSSHSLREEYQSCQCVALDAALLAGWAVKALLKPSSKWSQLYIANLHLLKWENQRSINKNGKLYVFGGEAYFGGEVYEDIMDSGDSDDGQQVDCEFQNGRNVYMVDLVGQRGWKKCANLPEPRRGFACGVLNGKVCVLGGVVSGRWSCESLVYDPKEDEWVSIAPMTWKRSGHHVVAVGDEFWVDGGEFGRKEVSIEVYHQGKDKWEYVEPERCHESERLFIMKGNFFLMTPLGMYRREEPSKNKSWKRLQSISFSNDEFYAGELEVVDTKVVNRELVALISDGNFRDTIGGLFRSEGFGTEKEEIELGVVACEFVEQHHWYPHLMCPIEL